LFSLALEGMRKTGYRSRWGRPAASGKLCFCVEHLPKNAKYKSLSNCYTGVFLYGVRRAREAIGTPSADVPATEEVGEGDEFDDRPPSAVKESYRTVAIEAMNKNVALHGAADRPAACKERPLA